jgi:CBS domain-containing protein
MEFFRIDERSKSAMTHKASDIMTRNVLVVGEEASVSDLIRLFVEDKISCAPVMNADGKLVGIVTKTDILGYFLDKDIDISVKKALENILEYSGENCFTGFQQESKVRNIMTIDPVTADMETSVQTLAQMMVEKNIHRIIITQDHEIKGIVSTIDILYHVAGIEKHE